MATIIPMKPEFQKLAGLHERIATRATQLFDYLDTMRGVLTKADRDELRAWATIATATVEDWRAFAAMEGRLRRRYVRKTDRLGEAKAPKRRTGTAGESGRARPPGKQRLKPRRASLAGSAHPG
jgi:hypothetical protein